MAKAYQEGKGWAIRVRAKGYSQYLSGYPTAKKAQDAAAEFLLEIKRKGMPAKLGPHRTCLAVALKTMLVSIFPSTRARRKRPAASMHICVPAPCRSSCSRKSRSPLPVSATSTCRFAMSLSEQFRAACANTVKCRLAVAKIRKESKRAWRAKTLQTSPRWIYRNSLMS